MTENNETNPKPTASAEPKPLASGSEVVIGLPNRPENVRFEHSADHVVPVFASYEDGRPFSGPAEGAIGQADWIGRFANGLPCGEFRIYWGGGITSSTCWFDEGQRIVDGDKL